MGACQDFVHIMQGLMGDLGSLPHYYQGTPAPIPTLLCFGYVGQHLQLPGCITFYPDPLLVYKLYLPRAATPTIYFLPLGASQSSAIFPLQL